MRGLLIIGFLITSFFVKAQTVQKQVIGNLGGVFFGGNYQVDCTVGETVIDTFSSGNITLYQGYHHAVDSSNNTASIKEHDFTANYTLFPNPTLVKATLSISNSNLDSELTILVYSLTGKLISAQSLMVTKLTESKTVIDIGNRRAGVYFIKITELNSSFSKTLRLIKQ